MTGTSCRGPPAPPCRPTATLTTPTMDGACPASPTWSCSPMALAPSPLLPPLRSKMANKELSSTARPTRNTTSRQSKVDSSNRIKVGSNREDSSSRAKVPINTTRLDTKARAIKANNRGKYLKASNTIRPTKASREGQEPRVSPAWARLITSRSTLECR